MSKDKKQEPGNKEQDELQNKIEELTQALQRERADAENLRRRTQEEKSRLGEFYKAMVVQDLLPALDNLERAFKHTPKDLKDHEYVKGLQGVLKQFEQCFAQLGVKRIKTIGEVFDPRLHEAVHFQDSPEQDSPDAVEVVCEELQPGYKIGDEVIRHAMVKVRMEQGTGNKEQEEKK